MPLPADLSKCIVIPESSEGLWGFAAPGAFGTMIKWDEASKNALRYYVDGTTFPGAETIAATQTAIRSAADEWEMACAVTFVEVFEKDDPQLKFTVVYDDAYLKLKSVIALAFLPNFILAKRLLRVGEMFFSGANGYGQVGTMRHELGHVLGFAHEHERPEALASVDTKKRIVITDFDPLSVMAYPHLLGLPCAELQLSARDKLGAGFVYGKSEKEGCLRFFECN
jgi:hypothetical protein